MKNLRALYLGRFQLFHKGHLECVKFMEQEPDVERIVVAICNKQYSRFDNEPITRQIQNPFTFEERNELVKKSLEDISKPVEIVGIKGVPVSSIWFNLIKYYAKPDVVYTNSMREIEVFEPGGIPTREIPDHIFEALNISHGQIIREMIAAGDNWERFVTPGCRDYFKESGLENELSIFYNNSKEGMKQVHEIQKRKGVKPYNTTSPKKYVVEKS